MGTAIVWGFKWYKGGNSCPDIIHESPLITYDHGPAWSHDHIPYSLHHNPLEDEYHEHIHNLHGHEQFTSSDIISDSLPKNGPYSAYSDVPATAPVINAADHDSRHKRQLVTEEQVSDTVFAFLGITNDGCRRRFICEMEFRSKINPFIRIAFGIVGRGLFSKYVNKNNINGRASSFRQCADVNPECVFIEEESKKNAENESLNQEDYEKRNLKITFNETDNKNADAMSTKYIQNNSNDPIVQEILSRGQSSKLSFTY